MCLSFILSISLSLSLSVHVSIFRSFSLSLLLTEWARTISMSTLKRIEVQLTRKWTEIKRRATTLDFVLSTEKAEQRKYRYKHSKR